jgi:hypothetical protein
MFLTGEKWEVRYKDAANLLKSFPSCKEASKAKDHEFFKHLQASFAMVQNSHMKGTVSTAWIGYIKVVSLGKPCMVKIPGTSYLIFNNLFLQVTLHRFPHPADT